MILPVSEFEKLPQDQFYKWAEEWNLIRIGGEAGLGFDECGIVARVARPLDDQGISICYLSTYLSDYILVQLLIQCLLSETYMARFPNRICNEH